MRNDIHKPISTKLSDFYSEESETENDFNPEQFGLLDNPGVVRFDSVDYPVVVTENSDDEYITVDEHNTAATDWLRVSYDNLNLGINTGGDTLNNIKDGRDIL